MKYPLSPPPPTRRRIFLMTLGNNSVEVFRRRINFNNHCSFNDEAATAHCFLPELHVQVMSYVHLLDGAVPNYGAHRLRTPPSASIIRNACRTNLYRARLRKRSTRGFLQIRPSIHPEGKCLMSGNTTAHAGPFGTWNLPVMLKVKGRPQAMRPGQPDPAAQ